MNFFLIFLISAALAVNTDKKCGKINGDEGSCIGPISSSPNEQQQILNQINGVRDNVAKGNVACNCTSGFCPKATNMYKLIWSDALANSAQDYINAKSPYSADHGYYDGGSRQGHSDKTHRTNSAYTHCQNTNCAANIQSTDSIGENIYVKYKWSSSNGEITQKIYTILELIDKASQSWDDGETMKVCPGEYYKTNHFTQDVYGETLYIGCGVGLFNETEYKLRNVIICQYHVQQLSGVDTYEITTGSPSCPSGYELDADLTSLCVSSTNVKTRRNNILGLGDNNKFNLFDPANYSFLEIIVLILIVVVLIFGIAGCILIYKRRKLKQELGNSELHTELSGDAKKSKNIQKKVEEKQNDIQIDYNPEPEKTTFDDKGATTVKI